MKHNVLISAVLLSLTLPTVALAINENTDPTKGPVLEARSWFRERADDAGLRSRIKMSIWDDPALNDTKINVDVRNGKVTLRGVVSTQAQADRAAEIAKSDKETLSLQNKLVVASPKDKPDSTFSARAGEKIDNAQTTARIKAKFLKEGLLEGSEINVDTLNDVVVLEGEVTSWDQYRKAEQLARSTDGVQKVINRLKVH